MNLYTNGCSWTWGGALDKHFRNKFTRVVNNDIRLKLVWPHYLGQILGAKKVTNLSMGCGSNQRIVRTTFDWLMKTPKKELENTVAVIQFAEFSRFDYYYDSGGPYENKPQNWYNCKIDSALLDLDYFSDRLISEEIVRKNQHKLISPIEEIYNTLTYINSLQQMMAQFGVKQVYFWHLGHQWHRWPDPFKDYLFNNFKLLDDYLITSSTFEIWSYQRSDLSNPHSHPSIEGHKQLAEHLHKEMVRKGYK